MAGSGTNRYGASFMLSSEKITPAVKRICQQRRRWRQCERGVAPPARTHARTYLPKVEEIRVGQQVGIALVEEHEVREVDAEVGDDGRHGIAQHLAVALVVALGGDELLENVPDVPGLVG